MTKRTLLHYWDELSAEQRRLIHDVLRSNDHHRKGLPMGLLPFVPVHEIVNLLRACPMSPWSEALFQVDAEAHADRWAEMDLRYSERYQKSRKVDAVIYGEILKIITNVPSKLATELVRWQAQECIAEGRE
jgi:hypothetical protein